MSDVVYDNRRKKRGLRFRTIRNRNQEAGATLVTPTFTLKTNSTDDTGSSTSDKITNNTAPNFDAVVGSLTAGDHLLIYRNTVLVVDHLVTAPEAGGSVITLSAGTLAEGVSSLRMKQVSGTAFSARSVAEVVTVDTTRPTLSSSSPADNATGASTTNNITLTFNENVALGTGNITLKLTSGDTTVESFNVATGVGSAGGTVAVSGAVVTINPFANLIDVTGYYILIPATAVTDIAGNGYLGIPSDKTVLNFVTGDFAAPILSSTTPSDNATNVSLTNNFTATFSESIQFGPTVLITLRLTSDDSVVETFNNASIGSTISISGPTLTINPTSDLTSALAYYILIGASSIQDLAGNAYAGIPSDKTAWNFTATGGSYTPGTEAAAFLARTSIAAGSADESNYGHLIDGLVADGVWSKLAALWILAAPDATTAGKNLVSTSYTLTNNGCTFTAYGGYNGTEGTAQYVDTGVSGFSDSFGNSHVMAWSNGDNTHANIQSTGAMMGFAKNTIIRVLIRLYARYTDDKYYADCGTSDYTPGVSLPGADSRHMYLANRTTPTAQEMFIDGAGQGGVTISSAGTGVSGTIVLLAQKTANEDGGGVPATTSSGLQLSAASVGSAMTSTDVANFWARLRDYRSAVGL